MNKYSSKKKNNESAVLHLTINITSRLVGLDTRLSAIHLKLPTSSRCESEICRNEVPFLNAVDVFVFRSYPMRSQRICSSVRGEPSAVQERIASSPGLTISLSEIDLIVAPSNKQSSKFLSTVSYPVHISKLTFNIYRYVDYSRSLRVNGFAAVNAGIGAFHADEIKLRAL